MLVKLFNAWKITHLVFEKDTDAYARDRDEEVMRQAKEAGVEVITRMGRTLYDPDELVRNNHGKPVMSISQVEHVSSLHPNIDGLELSESGRQGDWRGGQTHRYSHIAS